MPLLPRRLGTQPSQAAGVLRRGLSVLSSPCPTQAPRACGPALVPRRLFSASPRCREAPPPPPPGPGLDPPGAAPPPPPAAGYTALPTRRIVCLAGPDSAKFLQGMLTSSIFRLVPEAADGSPVEAGFYSGFLNAVGRVLHDVFVYSNTLGLDPASDQPKPGESFLIECSDSHAAQLMLLLRKYRLRNKIKFRLLDPDECQAYQVWDDGSLLAPAGDGAGAGLVVPATPGTIVLRDPRAPAMGFRVLSTGGRDIGPDVPVAPSDADAYRLRRYLLGVAEGGAEMQSQAALPLEANMDAMGGIDYRKGCYVGQELTIRTKHRGVVRKRILPVMLYRDGEPAPDRLEYRPADGDGGNPSAASIPPATSISPAGRGRSAGTFLAGVGNIGLGLCRLGMMTDIQLPGEEAQGPADPNREFLVRYGAESEGALKVKAFVPDWLRAKIEGGDPSTH